MFLIAAAIDDGKDETSFETLSPPEQHDSSLHIDAGEL
jgi:hypothetical protein